MRRMQSILVGSLCFALSLPAHAKFLVFLGENGLGALTVDVGGSILQAKQVDDKGPGGLKNALTFDNFGLKGTQGDLAIFNKSNLLSGPDDILRFNGDSTVVFYSIKGGQDGADIGLPTKLYDNVAIALEDAKGNISYTPTQGQPGYDGNLLPTFELNSGIVPEPHLLGFMLVGLGMVVFGFTMRKCSIVPPRLRPRRTISQS